MDEASCSKTKETSCSTNEETKDLDCAICLQPYVQPVELPCHHIFCYLCLKGIIQNSENCALCRQAIPSDFLDKPQLIDVEQKSVMFDGSYQWFYEGRNGWWQYDDRTSMDIETSYQKGDTQCELLIAGFMYVIDFQSCLQYRRDSFGQRRHIKRDLISIPKKGVAGIPLNCGKNHPASEQGDKFLQGKSSDEERRKGLKRKIDDVLIDSVESAKKAINGYGERLLQLMNLQKMVIEHLIKRVP